MHVSHNHPVVFSTLTIKSTMYLHRLLEINDTSVTGNSQREINTIFKKHCQSQKGSIKLVVARPLSPGAEDMDGISQLGMCRALQCTQFIGNCFPIIYLTVAALVKSNKSDP